MAVDPPKDVLHRYLQKGRESVVWKLEGLSDYDVRRPLVRTGTNLLGIVKHLTLVEAGYFGQTFDRPFRDLSPWFTQSAQPNDDMWATVDESRQQILDAYRETWAGADRTIGDLTLDSPGRVPWWGDDHPGATLHDILVHVIAETHRHAGHADIVRELIDGAAGWLPDDDNLWQPDSWQDHRDRLEEVARRFR